MAHTGIRVCDWGWSFEVILTCSGPWEAATSVVQRRQPGWQPGVPQPRAAPLKPLLHLQASAIGKNMTNAKTFLEKR
jgi:hypothetical protein